MFLKNTVMECEACGEFTSSLINDGIMFMSENTHIITSLLKFNYYLYRT